MPRRLLEALQFWPSFRRRHRTAAARKQNTSESPWIPYIQVNAVTSVLYKKAVSFGFIADKGAGIAGTGALFAPIVESSGKTANNLAMQVRKTNSRDVTLSTPLSQLAVGLSLERRIRMGERAKAVSHSKT